MTPRAASAAERKEPCRRSETSCRAPPRCSVLKVSVSVCYSLLWETFNFYLVLCRGELLEWSALKSRGCRFFISNIKRRLNVMKQHNDTLVEGWNSISSVTTEEIPLTFLSCTKNKIKKKNNITTERIRVSKISFTIYENILILFICREVKPTIIKCRWKNLERNNTFNF